MNKLFFAILGISFIATSNTTNACNITNPDEVTLNNKTICSTSSSPLLRGVSVLQVGETASWSVPAGSLNTVTPSGQTGNLQPGVNRFIYTITSNTEASPCNIDTSMVTIIVEREPDMASAGTSVYTCASTYQLNATSVANGIGTWTGGIVTPVNSATGIAILNKNQSNTFIWTVSNGTGAVCPDKLATVTITHTGDLTSATTAESQSKTISLNDPAPLLKGVYVTVFEYGNWSAVGPATITQNGQTSGLILGDNVFKYSITSVFASDCAPSVGIVTIKVSDITGIEEGLVATTNKKLIRILTPLGQELQPEQATEGLFIYQYSDGSTRKVMMQ